MQCPKCSGEMELVSYDQVEVDRCTSCGGLWFQPEELRALTLNNRISPMSPARMDTALILMPVNSPTW